MSRSDAEAVLGRAEVVIKQRTQAGQSRTGLLFGLRTPFRDFIWHTRRAAPSRTKRTWKSCVGARRDCRLFLIRPGRHRLWKFEALTLLRLRIAHTRTAPLCAGRCV